ncbi:MULTISPECIES: type II toxin-antitoxin system RelE/ParE family toxin [Xenorhabdus]|uniref:type II toxin-antitoxin system RelE/ParE family toxin n=1 Tax=Xenorhabdus TaxID=626 RepID=UPI00064AA832|nr:MULTISPECIES: type II toxin-antitoxin system RelE/ParE family toxin [Xenorhabdus]KLU15502.1 diaminopimelate decarboxylase [Xenorhabdus griffiniae]KOP32007.1 diaminopimelate decarboxylase [Xenorhabdus sp. GDc328]WFQ78631.1 type II toxin-antitoxin system RelE/ParE family toxin [Xenorhabdus sp. SF857]
MWTIETTDTFDEWFNVLDDTDRTNVLASMMVLRERGPMLPRPYADAVRGSFYSNMKELRVQSKGDPIRAFFAFDPKRKGILLCAGNKNGNEKRFYEIMIPIADREFTAHLEKLKKE